MEDFSVPKVEPIRFKIDDDVFEAASEVGGSLLRDVINMSRAAELQGADPESLTPEQRLEAAALIREQTNKMMTFIDLVLTEDSARRFAERLQSVTEPITIGQAFRVWTYLIGQYGNRPTQPSSPSVNGHDGTGVSSMAGAPPAA